MEAACIMTIGTFVIAMSPTVPTSAGFERSHANVALAAKQVAMGIGVPMPI